MITPLARKANRRRKLALSPVYVNDTQPIYNFPMGKSPAILIIGAILLCTAALAQHKPCTQAQNIQAEEESESLRSWDALYNSYRRYAHCENVSAAEGYSESVARILVNHWQTLPRLAQLVRKDQGFARFVRVDATMDMNDVAKIKDNSIHRCPAGLTSLCDKLRRDADAAIAEDAAYATH